MRSLISSIGGGYTRHEKALVDIYTAAHRVNNINYSCHVHSGEDFCRVEDEFSQQSLNIIRKIVFNYIELYKDKFNSKRPMSRIMFDCLLEPANLSLILDSVEN